MNSNHTSAASFKKLASAFSEERQAPMWVKPSDSSRQARTQKGFGGAFSTIILIPARIIIFTVWLSGGQGWLCG